MVRERRRDVMLYVLPLSAILVCVALTALSVQGRASLVWDAALFFGLVVNGVASWHLGFRRWAVWTFVLAAVSVALFTVIPFFVPSLR
jgi:hypothetical protein